MGKAQTGLKRTMRGTFPNLKNELHYNTIRYTITIECANAEVDFFIVATVLLEQTLIWPHPV